MTHRYTIILQTSKCTPEFSVTVTMDYVAVLNKISEISRSFHNPLRKRPAEWLWQARIKDEWISYPFIVLKGE